MKKLEMPTLDNCALWDAIVNNKTKHREELLAVRNRVFNRYGEYSMNFSWLGNVQPEEWGELKDDLISCYGDNVNFKKARKEIMKDVAKCPYCLLNTPNTLDHYFDKSEYPEYSVYAPNLVPCCSDCNTKKNTEVFNGSGNRQFIHFYCDDLPDEQFLFIRFECTDTQYIPEIKVFLEGCNELIASHFYRLELTKKYRKAVNDRLTPILYEIMSHYQDGDTVDEITDILQKRYNALVLQYGYNFWEACIYEGLLSSEEYFHSIFA